MLEDKLATEGVAMLNTVEVNKKLYTKRQVEWADAARALYEIIGYPSLRVFIHIISTNKIKDCPVTVEDVNISEKIYGPDMYAIKGKSTRPKPPVVVNDYVEIPKELIDAHKNVEVCADIMFIDGVPFLNTVTKNTKIIINHYLEDRSKETLVKKLQSTFRKLNQAGMTVKVLHADHEFECVKPDFEDMMEINICPKDQHVPDIERMNRVIKERYRALYHRNPYSMWPKIMIIRGVADVVKWLNSFPPAGGI